MEDLTTTTQAQTEIVVREDRPNPASVYLASLQSPASRETMRYALERVLRILSAQVPVDQFPWQQLRHEHVAAIRAQLAERCSPSTANQSLAALRGTLKAAWRMELMDSEHYHRACDVGSIRGHREPKGRHVSPGDIRQLFRACAQANDKWLGARNAAVVAILFGAGLRRAEAVSLNIDSIDLESGRLSVIGKGNKERMTFLPPGSLDAIRKWLEVRETAGNSRVRGRKTTAIAPTTPALLLSGKHGCNHTRMTPGGILFALNTAARRAGIKPFTPHDLRRTFIGELLDAGADLTSIQKMVGHASPNTTSRYDRRGERAKQKSASLLHVPYVEEKEEE